MSPEKKANFIDRKGLFGSLQSNTNVFIDCGERVSSRALPVQTVYACD